jgi:hypothetical protein
VGVALASFPAAPLDGTARSVTRLVWGLALVFGVAGLVLLAVTEPVVGATLVLVALVDGGIAWWLRAREPVAYLIEDDGLVVERRHAGPRRYVGRLAELRRGSLGLRVAGDGGAYGYLGKFRAGGRTVDAFVTSRRDVVLLSVGDRELALSPADPDAFIAAAGETDG